jgi:metal-sulfur cluster biosynthetic enzyme
MENPNPEVDLSSDVSDPLDKVSLEEFVAMELWHTRTGKNVLGEEEEPVTVDEVFQLVKDIKDPEHPELTLAQLKVVRKDCVRIKNGHVLLEYIPTIPTCSVAVLIGLTLLRKLQLCISRTKYKVHVRIAEGKHVQEKQVNKQLADHERVAAAMENPNLSKMVREGVYRTDSVPKHLVLF